MIIGITEEGYKEMVDFALYPRESSINYRGMLQDLKPRRLEDVWFFVSDELSGLANAVTDEIPLAKHQSC